MITMLTRHDIRVLRISTGLNRTLRDNEEKQTERTSTKLPKSLNQEAAHSPPPPPQTSSTDHETTLHSSTHSKSAGTPSHPHFPQYQAWVQAHQEQANASASYCDDQSTSSSRRNQVTSPSGPSPRRSGLVGAHIYLGKCAPHFGSLRRAIRRVQFGLGR